MGFEQLAVLKEQLSKQTTQAKPAKAKKPERPPREPRPEPAVKAKARTVDPVVLVIGKLQKRFPKAFPRNPAPKLPLKIGIFEDLKAHAQELALSEPELRDAIKTWCRGSRYWACLVEGSARVDLDGAPSGAVSAADGVRAKSLEAHRAARALAKSAEAEKTSA